MATVAIAKKPKESIIHVEGSPTLQVLLKKETPFEEAKSLLMEISGVPKSSKEEPWTIGKEGDRTAMLIRWKLTLTYSEYQHKLTIRADDLIGQQFLPVLEGYLQTRSTLKNNLRV